MTKLTPYLILTAFLLSIFIAIFYVSKRFAWSLGKSRTIYFFILFLFITLFSFGGVFIFLNKTSYTSHIIYIISAFSMGFILYFFLATIALDLVRILFKFPAPYFNFITIGITVFICTYGYINSYNIHITKTTIPVKGLSKNIKAVHLTDIHIGHFRANPEYLRNIVDKTNQENPDIVFFTGDYLDAAIALDDKHFSALRYLKAPLFFIEGNHDVSTNSKAILEKAKQFGATVLSNEMLLWNGIQIIGLNHMVADTTSFSPHIHPKRSTIQSTLDSLNPQKALPSILLHHSPDGIKYANEHGVNLYLSGHTHGGQLFPITLLAEQLFDYNKGLAQYADTYIYVSQGTGTFGPPLRLGTKTEIAVLHLVPQE